MKKRIIMYGTGGISHLLSKCLRNEKAEIIAYLDDFFEDKRCGEIDVPIITIDNLNNYQFDYICIAFGDVKKGFKTLLDGGGVEREKIFAYSCNPDERYDENIFQLQSDQYIKDMMNSSRVPEFFNITEKRNYLCSMNIPETTDVIENDFVREQTLALIAEEIKRKKVSGNVAELGVFKGTFSKKINYLFPDKLLYLFDTFEGFNNQDVIGDRQLEGEKLHAFDETSVEYVLSQMPYPSKCRVKKGYFPATYDLGEEQFCFVSVDADLYNPIKSGLEIFYKYLAKGGYIMVHDYNNFIYKGATQAVREFCDEKEISYVPIPDVAGSVIITK